MSARERPSGRRRATFAVVAALVVIGILVFRARGIAFDWKLFFETLHHVAWSWLAMAILLMLLTYLGRALRWEVMLRSQGGHASLRRLTSDTAIGYMAAVLLGRVGELVRPYLISVSAGVSFTSQVAAWFLERLLDLLAVLLLFGFALTRLPSRASLASTGLRWALSAGGYIAAVAGFLCILILILFRNFSATARERVLAALGFLPDDYRHRFQRLVEAFSNGVEATRDLRSLVLLIFYTVLEWALISGVYLALFQSFAALQALTITDVVIILGFVTFGSALQIPGIGGGVQITTVVVLTELYGLPLESASGIALFLWAVTFLVVVPLGLVCAVLRGTNWNKIRMLATDLPMGELS